MKLYRERDLKQYGIYCIKNLINNKVYIGKSKNIYERIRQHINNLNKKSKNENRHLINAWHKYERKSFEYFVIEYVKKVEDLKSRELYWIDFYDSTNRDKGYNLRRDSETKCIVLEETRIKLSEAQLNRYKNNPDENKKISEFFKKYWSNEENLNTMRNSLKLSKRKYNFLQYDKNKNFIKKWNSVDEIIENNPDYKWQNIYSVCNGYKKSYKGYIWEKELKI
jgi:group I intron endonuclease